MKTTFVVLSQVKIKLRNLDVCIKFLTKCSEYSMTAIYHCNIQKQQQQHPQVTGSKKNTEKTITEIS